MMTVFALEQLNDASADTFMVQTTNRLMKDRLRESRAKGKSGWNYERCSMGYLRIKLRNAVGRGDMIDVMNLAGMIHVRIASQDRSDADAADT